MLNFFLRVCELGGGTVLYQCVGLICIFVVTGVKITLLAISIFCEVPLLHNMLSFSLSFYFPTIFFQCWGQNLRPCMSNCVTFQGFFSQWSENICRILAINNLEVLNFFSWIYLGTLGRHRS